MATIDRILVPTDLSESSDKACQFAKKLAEETGGVVDLLHVIPNSVLMDEQNRGAVKIDQNVTDEIYPLIFKEADLKLNSLSKRFFQDGTRGETYIKVDRSPVHAITDRAVDGNYSMIVMSAKGKDESGMFRGSTTEDILRTSKVPVLSVFSDPDELASGRIVVPVDGSLLSMASVPVAVMIASLYGASITFLHVNEKLKFFTEQVPHKPEDIQSRKASEFLMNRLMDFLDSTTHHGLHVIDSELAGICGLVYKNREVEIDFEILTGFSAHHEITEYVNQFASMIVMTTHGRSGLAHMIMGSNTEKVALNVEKTVLTIRPDSKLFNINDDQIPDS